MKPVLFLGCPPADKTETGKQLAATGLSVVWADAVADAVTELERKDMALVVDLSTGEAALQGLRDIRAQYASTPAFALVDANRPDVTTEAVLAGVADVFTRPIRATELAAAITSETSRPSRRGGAAPDSNHLYAHSPRMRDVLALAEKAAGITGGVIIYGEDGSGRRVVARTIHTLQRGSAAGFVAVNCADHDGPDLERCIFGSAPGGHKTSTRNRARDLERLGRKALLSEARSGTLYLEHLSDASARVQTRLARVLRDREAVLAETGETIAVDLRPMAGVGAAFDRAAADGLMRSDLLKRVSGVRIDVPPLRDRREDVAPLANRFLRDICRERGLPPRTLSRSALVLMAALPWRGNARELRGLLENIVLGSQGGRHVGLEDVLSNVRLDGGTAAAPHGGTLKQARDAFERDYIAAVVDRSHGRIAEAARALGIQRTNLYRKMRALRIKNERPD